MYKVTIRKKNGYDEIELYYECQGEALEIINNVQLGDLDNEYRFVLEIVNKEE